MNAVLTLRPDEEMALSPAEATYDDVGVLLYQTLGETGPSVDAFGFELPSEDVDIAFERADGATASLMIAEDGELLDLVLRAPVAAGVKVALPPRSVRARLDGGEGGLVEADFTVAGEDGMIAITFAEAGDGSAAYWISETAFVVAEGSEVRAIFLTGVKRVAAEGRLV